MVKNTHFFSIWYVTFEQWFYKLVSQTINNEFDPYSSKLSIMNIHFIIMSLFTGYQKLLKVTKNCVTWNSIF